jgi:hypothetical protein
MRAEIPELWGFEFNPAVWNKGFVRVVGHLFLLVSLDKQGMASQHQYVDKFLTPTRFQWMSQNQTRRDQPSGQHIGNHVNSGTAVHLFVRDRPKTPTGTAMRFVYCGEVEFVSWEGDAPITVHWALRERVPEALWQRFGISDVDLDT